MEIHWGLMNTHFIFFPMANPGGLHLSKSMVLLPKPIDFLAYDPWNVHLQVLEALRIKRILKLSEASRTGHLEGNPLNSKENPLKFDGNPLKFDENPLKFNGNPLKLDGNPLKFNGNPLKFDGNPLKFNEIH